MTGFKGPDIDDGAQTFLQRPVSYFRHSFVSELTSKDSPRFQLAKLNYTVRGGKLALEKEFAGRRMGREKSHSERQKKRMSLGVPSVNLQQEGVQSATQDVSVMLLWTGYSGYLTMPLKDATIPVYSLGLIR